MHKRFITVPKNRKGIEEYYIGIENSCNLNIYILHEKDFHCLYPVLALINNRLGLMIDDYESEIIEFENLLKCKSIIEESEVNSPIFHHALEEAIRYKTILVLDF